MTSSPAGSADVVKNAFPPARTADPTFLPPSEKSTVPVGKVEPLVGATLAVRQIVNPWSACGADEETMVLVVARAADAASAASTAMSTVLEVDARKVALPA